MIGHEQLLEDNCALERVLDCGGAGIVVAARQRRLRRRLAPNFLRPDGPKGLEIVDCFVRQAQVRARLQNAHVTRIRAFTPRVARARSSARDSESANGRERPAESVVR
jgi:hypothetical protein